MLRSRNPWIITLLLPCLPSGFGHILCMCVYVWNFCCNFSGFHFQKCTQLPRSHRFFHRELFIPELLKRFSLTLWGLFSFFFLLKKKFFVSVFLPAPHWLLPFCLDDRRNWQLIPPCTSFCSIKHNVRYTEASEIRKTSLFRMKRKWPEIYPGAATDICVPSACFGRIRLPTHVTQIFPPNSCLPYLRHRRLIFVTLNLSKTKVI